MDSNYPVKRELEGAERAGESGLRRSGNDGGCYRVPPRGIGGTESVGCQSLLDSRAVGYR